MRPYVKRLAPGLWSITCGPKYRPDGVARRLADMEPPACLIEAYRSVNQSDFQELWLKRDGIASLIAIAIPLSRMPKVPQMRHPEWYSFGFWITHRVDDFVLGPGVRLSTKELNLISQRAADAARQLPVCTSLRKLEVIGCIPERGDYWLEAGPTEPVLVFEFTCAGFAHRYYFCLDSWAERFSIRPVDSDTWYDLKGDPREAVETIRSSARSARVSNRPAKGSPLELASKGDTETLERWAATQKNPDEVLYQWLCVAGAFGSVDAEVLLRDLYEGLLSRAGDETVADLRFEVAQWFAFGQNGIETNGEEAIVQLEEALKLRSLERTSDVEETLARMRAALPPENQSRFATLLARYGEPERAP